MAPRANACRNIWVYRTDPIIPHTSLSTILTGMSAGNTAKRPLCRKGYINTGWLYFVDDTCCDTS